MIKNTPKRRTKKIRVLIIAIVLVVVYIFGGYIAAYIIYSSNLSRVEILNPDWFFVYYTYLDADQEKYPRSEFTLTSKENKLTGYEYGEENNRGLIVMIPLQYMRIKIR